MTQLYRAQILLERKQHQALQALAAAEGRSMSEIIREAVADYLVDQTKEDESWTEWLAQAAILREEIKAGHGVLPEDFFLRDREEREEELWKRMTGEE